MLSVKDTKMISERERNELLDALKVASLLPHSLLPHSLLPRAHSLVSLAFSLRDVDAAR